MLTKLMIALQSECEVDYHFMRWHCYRRVLRMRSGPESSTQKPRFHHGERDSLALSM
jgi:hypothetical protein